MPEEATLVVDIEPLAADTVAVRVQGEFDLAGVESFHLAVAAACEAAPAVVELDLEAVSFIDSSGVGAIVVASRTAAARGAAMRIGARSPVVERVLEVSGLEEALRATNL
jgi:anti-sigma B factor antagonist